MNDSGVQDESLYDEQYSYDPVEQSTEDFEQLSPLRDQDRFLPIANVSKIMKKSVPNSGKVAKDSKETMQECVSEFISFITSEAAERCQQEKRKTINGEDIIFAMTSLGFDNFIEPLKTFLHKYREANKVDSPAIVEDTGAVLDDFSGNVTSPLFSGSGGHHQASASGNGTGGGGGTAGGGGGAVSEEMGVGQGGTLYVPYSSAGEFQQVTYVNGNQNQHCDTSAL